MTTIPYSRAKFHFYCTNHGIFQKFIAPGHPAANGLAERNIQTLKNRLRTLASESTPLQEKVQNILLRYRATPLACGKIPGELYLHRKIRIRLDAIFPYQPEPVKNPSKPVRSLQVGERVQVRLFINNKYVWEFANVKKKLGSRHYLVHLDSGRIIKRHINQLRPSLVPKKTVTFNIPGLPRSPDIQAQSPIRSPVIQPQSPIRSPVQSPAIQPPAARPVRNRRPPVRFGDYVLY